MMYDEVVINLGIGTIQTALNEFCLLFFLLFILWLAIDKLQDNCAVQ